MLITAVIFTLILEVLILIDYSLCSGRFFYTENRKMLKEALLVCAIPFVNVALILMILYSKSRT